MSDLDPAELTPSTGSSKKQEREGLPPTYRMRADAHYVDQLASRRAERPAEPAEYRERADSRERRNGSGRVFAQLAEDIATIESAAALLSNDASPMGRRVSLDLIRAQAWRAAWMLRASAIQDGTHRSQVRTRPVVSVLTQLREGFAPECRLNGTTLQVQASDWNASVAVDETALLAGVTGAVVAMLGLLGQAEGGAVKVNAEIASGELRAIEVSQDETSLPPGVTGRFLDPAWTDRPGGWAATLGATTAKAVAQQHGGDATFLSNDRRGTTLRLTFGRA